MQDALSKNRIVLQTVKMMRMLSHNQVNMIRKDTRSLRLIAKDFDIGKDVVRNIKRGRTYKDVL